MMPVAVCCPLARGGPAAMETEPVACHGNGPAAGLAPQMKNDTLEERRTVRRRTKIRKKSSKKPSSTCAQVTRRASSSPGPQSE
ncbi:hypothetical protein ANANG_G00109640 [Anguilla anguilla]|uniref:Uncharacterized protein n=1 Tax=Anguilla anguilla TaxID=7936 RepID=A0A9D3ML85_ANGAN|nr:hypothetical protein ANANG_G00109640 [Anguilla anguilla]